MSKKPSLDSMSKNTSRTSKTEPKVESPSISQPDFVYDPGRKKRRKHPRLRVIFLCIIGLFLVGGVAFAAHSYLSLHKVIQRNTGIAAAGLKGDIELAKLKGEGEGRVNILLLGVGDSNHSGAQLSDTMLVLSVDPHTNDVAMLGIPRDLWVTIPGYGYNKINAAHAYGEQAKRDGGPELAKKVVSTTLGIPIHYFVRLDFTAFQKAINTVGGVDINVAESLYDSEYPCEQNEGRVCGFKLAAGPQHMNGTVALRYVRCRKGNCGDDFGRAKRQQQVLEALRSEALSAKTLLDPTKISGLIDAVGDNVRTDLQLGDITRLIDITKKVDTSKIVNAVLDNTVDGNNLVRTANIGGASVVIPAAGTGDFSAIQRFVRGIFVDGYIKQEAAAVAVQNGTAKIGLGLTAANLLKGYGYNVVSITPADSTTYSTTKIIDYTGGKKPYTIKYLENRFGIVAERVSTPAASQPQSPQISGTALSTSPDVVVIVGTDYKPQSNL